MNEQPPDPTPHHRRKRYSGKNPRKHSEKYKELNPEQYPETVAKVLASGKTPAGSHVPIMVREILEILAPRPGEIAVDCTLGHGGHAREILPRLLPTGKLIGLDVDPIEQPKTEQRLRALGFNESSFVVHRSNFAGLRRVLAAEALTGADCILADLGVSSMQLDDPVRGFSTKTAGPLDMRMNPNRGQAASELISRATPEKLTEILTLNSDEPNARILAESLAGRRYATTTLLAADIRRLLPKLREEEQDKSVRRVFQALRIEVNDEFGALDGLLRDLPECLNPGGRVAILTFHSGEDRRVKKAFEASHREGILAKIAEEIIRPTSEETHANPRASAAKLRWAIR